MEKITNYFKSKSFKQAYLTILIAILTAFLAIIILSIAKGANPIGVVTTLLFHSFENMRSIGDVFSRMGWLIPVALSFGIAFKAGLFNIGMSGQMLFAGMFGVYLGIQGVHWIIIVPLMIMLGALIGGITGYLKAQFKIHEVVSTIMLNWSIFYVYRFVYKVGRSFITETDNSSLPIKDAASLRVGFLSDIFGNIYNKSTISLSIIFAIIVVVALHVFVKYTRQGYEMNATGLSEKAARNAGINTKFNIIKAMAIAGGLSGLAGAAYYLGTSGTLTGISTVPSQGFDGITVSLIGGNSPIGILISSFFYALINESAPGLNNKFGFDSNFITIINATLILGIAIAPFIIKRYFGKKKDGVK